MAKVINNFLKGKMNKDLDERLVPKGEYREAVNLLITHSEDSDVGAIENILGNDLAYNNEFLDSHHLNKGVETIGYYSDVLNKRVYWFITNFIGDSGNTNAMARASSDHICQIIYLDLNQSSTPKVLVKGSFLNFSKNHLITGVNLIDDLLFWTDNYNQPRKINISTALQEPLYYDTEEKISVAKFTPYIAPILVNSSGEGHGSELSNYEGIDSKYLEENFVRFSYRYKFQDGEYSAIAPFTQIVFAPLNEGRIKMESHVDFNEENIYRNFIVDLMENNYNNIKIRIPVYSPENLTQIETDSNGDQTWVNHLKIDHIELLLKESDQGVIKSVAKIEVDNTFTDSDKINNAEDSADNKPGMETYTVSPTSESNYIRYAYRYIYKSEEPYKILESTQITRSYDHIPIRAKAQEISGNRVIYGNYTENHELPFDSSGKTGINYVINYTDKGDLEYSGGASSTGLVQNLKNAYKFHSIKQRRNYQVGVVLADKFGRQSSVILSTNTSNKFLSDTIKVPIVNTVQNTGYPNEYTWSGLQAGSIGQSLSIKFNDDMVIPQHQVYNGDINSPNYNPNGWYSWRLVVKQLEQDYYNVYASYAADSFNPNTSAIDKTDAGRSWLALEGDNINKVPRIVPEDNVDPDGAAASELKLFPKVIKNGSTNSINDSVLSGAIKPIEVISIGTAKEHGLVNDDFIPYDFIGSSKRNPVLAELNNLATGQGEGNHVLLHTSAVVQTQLDVDDIGNAMEEDDVNRFFTIKTENPFIKVGQYVYIPESSGGVVTEAQFPNQETTTAAMFDEKVGTWRLKESVNNTKVLTLFNGATWTGELFEGQVTAEDIYGNQIANVQNNDDPLLLKEGMYLKLVDANGEYIKTTDSAGNIFRPNIIHIEKQMNMAGFLQSVVITLDKAVSVAHTAQGTAEGADLAGVEVYNYTTVESVKYRQDLSGTLYQEIEISKPTNIPSDTFIVFKNIDKSPVSVKRGLTVFETDPVESNLDIFYETSTSGLVSDLNEEASVIYEQPHSLSLDNNTFLESFGNNDVIGNFTASEVTPGVTGMTFQILGITTDNEDFNQNSFTVDSNQLKLNSSGFVWNPVEIQQAKNKFTLQVLYQEAGGGDNTENVDIYIENSSPEFGANSDQTFINDDVGAGAVIWESSIVNGSNNANLSDRHLSVKLSAPDHPWIPAGSFNETGTRPVIDNLYYTGQSIINNGMLAHEIVGGQMYIKINGDGENSFFNPTAFFHGTWLWEGEGDIFNPSEEPSTTETERTIKVEIFDGGNGSTINLFGEEVITGDGVTAWSTENIPNDGILDGVLSAEDSFLIGLGSSRRPVHFEYRQTNQEPWGDEALWFVGWHNGIYAPSDGIGANLGNITQTPHKLHPGNRVWEESIMSDDTYLANDGYYRYVWKVEEGTNAFGDMDYVYFRATFQITGGNGEIGVIDFDQIGTTGD